jgi:hypothetical protein
MREKGGIGNTIDIILDKIGDVIDNYVYALKE